MTAIDPITSSVQARVGTILAQKYRLLRVLGTGGMGAVFEAENTWTERRVAIKLMIGPRVHDADLAARFLREARAASKIEHPNVVHVLDMGQDPDDGTLYIVQELLAGRDLRSVLDERRMLAPREAFEYLLPVMAGLISAHDRGIVHRDLKPENVFIARTPDGVKPKLIDFGLAKVKDAGRSDMSLSRTGEAMGTPYYMSPEQARGERAIDAQTDVWAMGAVWFEVLSGRCPFLGDSYNELLAKILTEDAPPLASLAPPLPTGLADVIQRSLQGDRAVRYRSMQAFMRALIDEVHVQGGWHRELSRSYVRLVGSNEYDDAATSIVPRPDADIAHDDTLFAHAPPPDASLAMSSPAAASMNNAPIAPTPIATQDPFVAAASPIHPRATNVRPIAIVTTLAALGLAAGWMTYRMTRTPASPAVIAPPRSPTTDVAIDTDPPNATVSIDGTVAGVGSIRRTMVIDGHAHTLAVRANGYAPHEVSFESVAPHGLIRLEPLGPAIAADVLRDAGGPATHAPIGPAVHPVVRRATPANGETRLRPRSDYP